MLKSGSPISGHKGQVKIEINGIIKDLGMCKKYEATVTKSKKEITCIGNNWKHHKGGLLSGSGSMVLYYVTPEFRAMMSEFDRTHKDAYFKMFIINDDEGSDAGTQTVILHDCNIDSVIITTLDSEAEALEETVPFTFSGYQIVSSFNEISID